jgi:hypothetical protein
MEERFQVKTFLTKDLEELDKLINEFLIDKLVPHVIDIDIEVIELEDNTLNFFGFIKYMTEFVKPPP